MSPAIERSDTELPFGVVFAHALAGEPCRVVVPGIAPFPLPVADWDCAPTDADHELLARCTGATLDIGCGPGRLTAELAARGQVVLGIDVVGEAVGRTVARGGTALRRDVFGRVPGEGRWQTALLADGNIGIGGDPGALLARVRELLAPGGRAVVEVAPDGTRTGPVQARLECRCARSEPFRWALLAAPEVPAIAGRTGFAVLATERWGDRRWAVLGRSA